MTTNGVVSFPISTRSAPTFSDPPQEAVAMDPQHRMLLGLPEALEHAGIPPDSLSGTRTGVMMGLSSWDTRSSISSAGRHRRVPDANPALCRGWGGSRICWDSWSGRRRRYRLFVVAGGTWRVRAFAVKPTWHWRAGAASLTVHRHRAVRRCHRQADATTSTPTRMDSCAARTAVVVLKRWPTRCDQDQVLAVVRGWQLTPMVGPTAWPHRTRWRSVACPHRPQACGCYP